MAGDDPRGLSIIFAIYSVLGAVTAFLAFSSLYYFFLRMKPNARLTFFRGLFVTWAIPIIVFMFAFWIPKVGVLGLADPERYVYFQIAASILVVAVLKIRLKD